MALSEIDDINNMILDFVGCEYLIKCVLINKKNYEYIKQLSIYQEVLSLCNKYRNLDFIKYPMNTMTICCASGMIHVAQQLYKRGYNIKFHGIFFCESKNFPIVKWLHDIKLTSERITINIHKIIINNDIDILEWFYKSGLKLHYTTDTIDDAAKKGHIKVLEWFNKNKILY